MLVSDWFWEWENFQYNPKSRRRVWFRSVSEGGMDVQTVLIKIRHIDFHKTLVD